MFSKATLGIYSDYKVSDQGWNIVKYIGNAFEFPEDKYNDEYIYKLKFLQRDHRSVWLLIITNYPVAYKYY